MAAILEDYGAFARNASDHSEEKYYVSTAIAYTNGNPHIGHAYEFLSADVIARFHRMLGQNTFFLTGTDEHGQKVAASAEAAGVTPKAHCDKYVDAFQSLHKKLLISYNDFIRTTDPVHEKNAQALWTKCAEAGDIYLSTYEGWYNEREETFVTDSEAEAAGFLDVSSGLPLKRVTEESYFFAMSKFTDRLIAHIEEHPEFIQPDMYRNNIMARLKTDGLRDLSISRTTFSWGIPVPAGFDAKHVMYVWFDALTNYISGVHGLNGDHPLSSFWPANTHIVGKDIVWFHCVIWPCMLLSAGVPLPRQIFSHGFVSAADGRKMSKSFNNAINPDDVLEKFSVDSLRYYLTASVTYGADVNFSEDNMTTMHNSELADILGNLVHRVFSLAVKYCNGKVPDCEHDEIVRLPFDLTVLRASIKADVDVCAIHLAAHKAMDAVRAVNKWLSDAEPWKMKGENEPRRIRVVRTALEAVYVCMHFLAPILPVAAQEVFNKLSTPPRSVMNLRSDMYNLTPGATLSVGAILFQKIEDPTEATEGAAAASGAKAVKGAPAAKGGAKSKASSAPPTGDDAVHVHEYTKMLLRVGRISKVWNHPTAERLYCLQIDMGDGELREVASGLRQIYLDPDTQLLNRLVVVACNLKESKFQGFPSNGMVLAAKAVDGSGVELIGVPEGSIVGERVLAVSRDHVFGGASVVAACAATPLAFSVAKAKKMKVWETVSKDLCTDSSGVACWKELQLSTSAGACTVSSLVAAPIS